MTHTDRIKNIHGIAMALAPGLQRYDFADPKDKKAWAEHTYACAEEFWNLILPRFEGAMAQDILEQKAAQEKAMKEAEERKEERERAAYAKVVTAEPEVTK